MDRHRQAPVVSWVPLVALVLLAGMLQPVPPASMEPLSAPAAVVEAGELEQLRSALDRAIAAEDVEGRVRLLRRLGRVELNQGRAAKALERFEEALVLARSFEPSRRLAGLLDDRGSAARRAGEPELARSSFEEALVVAQGLGDLREETVALNNLAVLARDALQMGRSLDLFTQALAGWQALGEVEGEAATLLNLGSNYTLVGLDREAIEVLEQALALERRLGRAHRTADVLVALGRARYWNGEIESAREHYLEALELQRSVDDARGRAATLDHLGTVDRALGHPDVALVRYSEALAFFEGVGDRRSQAHTVNNLAETLAELGRPVDAAGRHLQALELLRRVGDRAGEARALYGQARVARTLGRLEEARERSEQALAITEAARQTAPLDTASGLHLRSSYLAAVHGYHRFHLDVLMELHAREPGGGYDQQVLLWSERARARRLLDLLGVAPETLGLEALRAVLDEQTSLLLYTLGDQRSLLLHVTHRGLSSHPLPPPAELEAAAHRLHRLLAASRRRGARVQAELAVAEMGRVLLGPVAPELGSQRLLVVADGALLLVPFGALPVPSHAALSAPLVARHEVVHSPSLSTFGALHRGAPAASSGVVVVADPVVAADDPRLPLPTAAGADEPLRLPHSNAEAQAILHLADGQPTLDLRGFTANRETVLAGGLAGQRYVHFATHALIDSEEPSRSGLILSQFHADGRRREGLLAVPDIHRLRLSARLVVLSGCRTALGQELRGEGLLGLGHGFLDAGARALLVALWTVDDRATAELMGRFYDALLHRGQSPAAALRRAQDSMRREPRWSAPAFWAAFVLEGDGFAGESSPPH